MAEVSPLGTDASSIRHLLASFKDALAAVARAHKLGG
jgi:hypothetical protein